MKPSEEDKKLQGLREKMVDQQIAGRGIQDPNVLQAMRTIPRHLFVAHGLRFSAYDDNPMPIGEGQTISQPYIVALMTELLEVQPQDKVLEIGTGSGYQAAVLGRLAKEVYSVEIKGALLEQAKGVLKNLGCENVYLLHGDGRQGWPQHAPYDKILVTAAPITVPRPLLEQLKEGGKLVAPVGGYSQELVVLTKTAKGIHQQESIPVRFVPLLGSD